MIVNSANRPQQVANTEQVAGSNNSNNRVAPDDGGVKANLSPNIPRMSIRSRAARTPTSSERSGLFRALGSCFGIRPRGGQRSSSSVSSTGRAYTPAPIPQGISGYLDASITGIAAAKKNATEGLASSKSSSDVVSFFDSNDKGIRKATTAIYCLGNAASFGRLTAAEKQKMPAESLETLKTQSTQISQMANTVLSSKFLDGTEALSQFGTSSQGYKEALEKHPEQDHAIRAWVQDGLNLGNELINTQEQILGQGRVQSQSYIRDLQSRVNVFASLERDVSASVDINNVAEGFADEVLEQTPTS